jgi:hypothetical protein
MNRTQQLAGIGLLVAFSLMLIGWAQSYPVSLASVDDSNLDHINLLFWIGLCLGYPSLFLFGIKSSAPLRALSCVLFMILFTAPKLLYVQAGSDTETFISLLDVLAQGRMLSFEAQTYSQWPIVTMWGRLLQMYCQCDSAIVYWFFWGIQILGFGLAGYLLFSEEPHQNPADFLGLYLWVSVLFWFWDWQVSAYNLALIFVFTIISLLPHERLPFRILVVLLFSVLTFSHGFVPVWILTIVPSVMILKWVWMLALKARDYYRQARPNYKFSLNRLPREKLSFSSTLHWLYLFLILASIQLLVLTFHSSRLVTRIILTVQDYYTKILAAQLSSTTVTRYVSMAAAPPTDPFDIVTKWLAWIDLGLNAMLIGICFLALLWWKRWVLFNWAILLSVFLTGAGHYMAGNLLPILGARALNIILILPVQGLKVLLLHKNLRRPILAIFFVAMTLYPVNQLRMQMRHTQYNTMESLRAVRYVLPVIEQDLQRGESILKVLSDQPQAHYLWTGLPRLSLYSLSYRARELEVDDFDYVLASAETDVALADRNWPKTDEILANGRAYNRIYDSGRYVWFRMTPYETEATASTGCQLCISAMTKDEMDRDRP